MFFRRMLFVWGLSALACLPAFGQNRPQNPVRPGQTPARPGQNVNERHERAKTEAQDAYQKGDFQHALTLANSVLGENPRDDVALYLRASSRIEVGRRNNDAKMLRDGVADARQSIALKPRDNTLYYLPYIYGMASLSQAEDRPEHAEVAAKIAEQIVAIPGVKPEDKANIYYQLGVCHNTLKKPEDAAKDFEASLKLVPTHVGSHLALADSFVRAGKPDLAANAYDRAVGLLPRNPMIQNNRGMFRQSRGDQQGAMEDYTRALQLDDTFAVAYTNRGYLLLSQGNMQAAEADFSASLNVNPNQDSVYSFRGASRLGQGKVDAAIQDFAALSERAPKNPVAWSDLGFARFFAKDYKGASVAFERASSLNTKMNYLDPWRYWSLSLSGASSDKLEAFAKSVSDSPKEGDWIGGLTAYAVGKIDDAELMKFSDSKNKRLQKDQECEARFFAGLKLSQEGKSKEAAAEFQKALDSGSQHLSAYRGAQFALKKFEGDN